MTRPGLAIVGVCRLSPPGLNRTHAEGEDAGLRVRGLWCFERLIRIGHMGPPGESRHQPLPPGVLPGGRSSDRRRSHPGACRAKGLCRGGIDLREDGARRPGQNWPFRLVRFSVRTRGRDPSIGAGFRALVGLARCGHQFCGRGPAQPQARQRQSRGGLRGAYGIESGLPHPAVRREARIIAWV